MISIILYILKIVRFLFRALAVPTADYTYDDCRVAVKAGQLGLPMTSNLITVERLRSRLGWVVKSMIWLLLYRGRMRRWRGHVDTVDHHDDKSIPRRTLFRKRRYIYRIWYIIIYILRMCLVFNRVIMHIITLNGYGRILYNIIPSTIIPCIVMLYQFWRSP